MRPIAMRQLAPACSASSGRSSSLLRPQPGAARSFLSNSLPPISASPKCLLFGRRSPFIGNVRCLSKDVKHEPNIKDYEMYYTYKDLMADGWDDLSDSFVYDVENALSRDTDDKAGQEILENVLRSAEAVEESSGALMSLKMELDDSVGLTGEMKE